MILTSLLVNILRDFKANFFPRNQFWKIDFMLNLHFQLANGLAQDFHVIHKLADLMNLLNKLIGVLEMQILA